MAIRTSFRSRIAANGQVVIPKEFRQALGLNGGDMVLFIAEEDSSGVLQVAIRRPTRSFAELIGSLQHLAKAPYASALKTLGEEEAG